MKKTFLLLALVITSGFISRQACAAAQDQVNLLLVEIKSDLKTVTAWLGEEVGKKSGIVFLPAASTPGTLLEESQFDFEIEFDMGGAALATDEVKSLPFATLDGKRIANEMPSSLVLPLIRVGMNYGLGDFLFMDNASAGLALGGMAVGVGSADLQLSVFEGSFKNRAFSVKDDSFADIDFGVRAGIQIGSVSFEKYSKEVRVETNYTETSKFTGKYNLDFTQYGTGLDFTISREFGSFNPWANASADFVFGSIETELHAQGTLEAKSTINPAIDFTLATPFDIKGSSETSPDMFSASVSGGINWNTRIATFGLGGLIAMPSQAWLLKMAVSKDFGG